MAWSRMLGHDHWVRLFGDIVARKRLGHAYLFVGPEGVGKRLFARELARTLLCAHAGPENFQACDRCSECLLIDAGTHPDFFAVQRPEDASELPIEVMRELCRGFLLTSARGRGKVAVLDDADDLNEASANCFLKTLEEPPPRSVFILVGTAAERQLPTIRSRCQTIRFAPLPADLVDRILKNNGLEDAGQRERLVRAAEGSPGKALALADPKLWEFRRGLLQGLAAQHIDAFSLGRALAEFAEDAGKETAAQRRRAALVLELLLAALADALHLAQEAPPRVSGPEDEPILRALLQRGGTNGLLQAMECCLEAERRFDRYLQVSLVGEGLVDGLAQVLDRPPGT